MTEASVFDEIDGRLEEIHTHLGVVMGLLVKGARDLHNAREQRDAAAKAKEVAEAERDAARAEVAALRTRQRPVFPYYPYPQPYWDQLTYSKWPANVSYSVSPSSADAAAIKDRVAAMDVAVSTVLGV